MWFQCVSYHRQFSWSGFEQTAVKKLDLFLIYRKEGKAGVKAFFGFDFRIFGDLMKFSDLPRNGDRPIALPREVYPLLPPSMIELTDVRCFLVLVTLPFS